MPGGALGGVPRLAVPRGGTANLIAPASALDALALTLPVDGRVNGPYDMP
ncbi:hypothetical protein GCM10010329_31780 [Streptomyces spiroverticillatus]|uniref:Uncharacterized protein n=1 Tax=Streptomyces finlayi TaxID=67296 RepID=A0A919C995_9ACTN|nr:hypothetical protein GCM10010329_31780 [Streptomyces spiroverticillatus]GHC90302.1 hypothetical protein GCM10010334_24190 [Streptomyces finlayi]